MRGARRPPPTARPRRSCRPRPLPPRGRPRRRRPPRPRRARRRAGSARARRGAPPRPGSKPCVSSTRAPSSASRAWAPAASRVSSSWRRRAASSSRQAVRRAARRRSWSAPAKASRTSSWYDVLARRRCSNCPDMATSRSAAPATSSRAAERPQGAPVCARQRTHGARVRGHPLPRAAARQAARGRPPRGSRSAPRARPHPRVLPGEADEARVAFCAEQQPERLREDRLARSGLARDDVEPAPRRVGRRG